MKKGLLISILFTLVLICLPGNIASAESYEELTYTITEGGISIIKCSKNAITVDIPDEINNIPVTCIEESAFYGCSSLLSVSIPNTIKNVGFNAFYGCSSLEKVCIEDISSWCGINFDGYRANPLYLANNLYCNNTLVSDLIIPDNVVSIGESAFYGCESIVTISIPKNLRSIGSEAFYECNNLEKVVVEDISSWCSIDFGYMANPLYYARSLYNNDKLVTDLIIKEDASKINNNAFENCSSLVSVVIPSSVEFIGDDAFRGCTSLNTLSIEYGVTNIGDYAFSGCKSLTSVTIPNSVTQMGVKAFYGCSKIEEMIIPFTGSTRNGLEHNSAFGYIFDYDEYPLTSNGQSYKIYTYKIPSSLKKLVITDEDIIDNESLRNCDKIETISLLDGVTTIREGAFVYCSALKNITLSDSITTINERAFSGCEKLEKIDIPNKISEINEETFKNCVSLTSIKLPDTLEKINSSAFTGCSSLNSVDFPEGLKHIGDYAFSSCNIERALIPNNVTTIGQGAFYNCPILTEVSLPDGLIDISDSMFSNCSSLESLTIHDSILNVGENAFLNCKSLKRVEIPKSVLGVGVSAFGGCSSLEEITLPFIGSQRGNSGTIDSVFGHIFGYVTSSLDATTDDTRQYYASTGYAYYHIPASLKTVTITDESFVGYGAFYGCTNISDIVIDSDVKAIGSRAFAYHYNLLNVTIKSTSPKFADSLVFYETDFATLYGYPGSTVEEHATKNGIDFESLVMSGHCEIDGSIKAINSTLVVSVDLNAIVTDECLHIALYTDNGQMVDYIIVPSDKPFNTMNVVFKDNKDSSYAKVFLWNGVTSMQPLTEAKRIDIVR